VALCRSFHFGGKHVANIDFNFLWEALALAAGIPPSAWQTVHDHNVAVAGPDEDRFPCPSDRQGLSGRKS
jgi:hypothetical protein